MTDGSFLRPRRTTSAPAHQIEVSGIAATKATPTPAVVRGTEAGTCTAGAYYCPDEVRDAAWEHAWDAIWRCWNNGEHADVKVNCWHLGGGHWHYSARISCKPIKPLQ